MIEQPVLFTEEEDKTYMEFQQDAKRMIEVKDQLKKLKKEEMKLKGDLVKEMHLLGYKSKRVDGFIFSRVPAQTRYSIDSAMIKEKEPEIFKKYLKHKMIKEFVKVSVDTIGDDDE